MNRAKDYLNFAGWFAGVGYMAMWPVASSGDSGQPFGASLLCGDHASSEWVCHAMRPIRLPEGLHELGFLAALFVAFRIVLYVVRWFRRRPESLALVPPSDVPIVPAPVTAVRLRLRAPAPPPHRAVKPRTHFGLRNVPR